MALAVRPPVAPMLARLARELPTGAYRYEPKWDGFRCLVFRDGNDVDLRSRHDRPLARYFPEVVEGLRRLSSESATLDGELILATASGDASEVGGPPGVGRPFGAATGSVRGDVDAGPAAADRSRARFDFAALMSRLHPAASRVERLARETPAVYIAFDLLGVGEEDLRPCGFGHRRARLEALLAEVPPPVVLTPATNDREAASRWFERFRGGGIDGVVAKGEDEPYEPGRRTMIKVKHERTADCVVAGMRLLPAEPARVSSLLLGLYDERAELRHVGVVTQFPAAQRVALVRELAELVIPLDRHPWRLGFAIGASPLGRLKGSAARWMPDMEHDWLPLRPNRVAEVAFDQVDVDRFRHPAKFRRWRPDRSPESCRLDQIQPPAPDLGSVLDVPDLARVRWGAS